ncbi:hypothetical protein EJB05_06004, partial [Eragrostis curvula]
MAAASGAGTGLAAEEGQPSWLRRCVEATLKGFAIGSGLKGGLALISALARLRRSPLVQALALTRREVTARTNVEAVLRAVKDTVRHGIFLGAFAGTYVSVDECIAAVWGRKRSVMSGLKLKPSNQSLGMLGSHRTARWRSLLAGLVAGPTMLLTGLETRHTSLATYIIVRASVLAARCGLKSKRFGKICKPLAWSQGDIFLMCLSSAQIASAYILNKDSFPSSYKAFLSKQIGKDPIVLQGLKELVNNNALTSLAIIEKYYKTVGVDIKLDPEMKVPCSAYGRALPVYVPVYLIPAFAIHQTHLVRSMITLISCIGQVVPNGLALLIEKKSRRIEISLYCFARAIESFSTCIAEAGLYPPKLLIKRTDIVVFSIATSIIMHCYAQERDVFLSKYLDVLDWVFGVPAPYVNENKIYAPSK